MGPGHRFVNDVSDLNRQVPSQRQWNSATQTKGELTTVADRPERDIRSSPRTRSPDLAARRSGAGHNLRRDLQHGGAAPSLSDQV